MNKSNHCKISIERLDNILDNGHIIPRCYEITYLKPINKITINIDKDENKSNNIYKGNGLCGRWCYENKRYMLFFQINIVADEEGYDKAKEKDKIIREELPLMLNSIIKSEEKFLRKNKNLNEAEIFIKFNSLYDDLYKVESWGKLKHYINIEKYNRGSKEKEYDNKLKTMKNKINVDKNLILNLINPYIETYLIPMYGKGTKFLLRDIEILSIKELKEITSDFNEHEIVISVKILYMKNIEEVILEIRVKPNGVLIKKIV